MSYLDWIVLLITISGIMLYGVWKGKQYKTLDSYLRSNKDLKWSTIGLSIIATQASAITFLSTPGQAFDDGMRFAQLYFGVPLAMIVLSVTFVPLYHKLNIYTAYEFLEKRFDFKTRILGAVLFLIQRGLAVGFTIYAPSLVLSNILGWNIYATSIVTGLIIIFYTVIGGTRAISYAHRQQMFVILFGMALAGFMIVDKMPEDISFDDAVIIADKMGKLNTIDWTFDLSERYNIWSGVLGGFFLSLAYFGTDQSQVQRYLSGRSIRQSRIGLMFNGIAKIPMQLLILFMGVMLFVFYQFEKPPIFFNTHQHQSVYQSEYSLDLQFLETRHDEIYIIKKQKIRAMLKAIKDGNDILSNILQADLLELENEARTLKSEAVQLIAMNNPGTNTNDLDQIFLTFVTSYLPKGLIGLLIAVIISASMSSASSILNALAGTSVIDIYKRIISKKQNESHYLKVSKYFTVFWGLIAILFALYANNLGNLIQAINILGSLFYGSILGIFLAAFYFKPIQGNSIFLAAIVAQILVFLCFIFTNISFLWFNVIGCVAVIVFGYMLQYSFYRKEHSN